VFRLGSQLQYDFLQDQLALTPGAVLLLSLFALHAWASVA
jgi:hypothetical protein